MISKRKIKILNVMLVLTVIFLTGCAKENNKIEVIYSTDLWTDGDFDDYFDLAVMYSLDDVNIHLVLDNAVGNNRDVQSDKSYGGGL